MNSDVELLKKTARDFYNVSKNLIVIYDSNREILCTYPESMCRFCEEVRRSDKLAKQCFLCDEEALDRCEATKKIYIYQCHMQLTEAFIPICDNGVIFGYLNFGQLLTDENKDQVVAHIRQTARHYKVDETVLLEELDKMRTIDSTTIESLARIMEMTTCYLWQNQLIGEQYNRLVQHIVNYIDEHMQEELSVPELCRTLNISKSTLYRVSTRYLGMSISEYIRSKRIFKAVQLIRRNTYTITEIAARVGIKDPNYFTKVFKEVIGYTPTQYIDQYVHYKDYKQKGAVPQ